MPTVDHWSEEVTIPLDIEPEELFYELLSRTKSHTSRIHSVLMVSEKIATEHPDQIEQYGIPALLSNANETMERLWVFIRKLDAYTKAKQEEYRNSKE